LDQLPGFEIALRAVGFRRDGALEGIFAADIENSLFNKVTLNNA
jgi:hypothetical protein